jgi:hypothetical protein
LLGGWLCISFGIIAQPGRYQAANAMPRRSKPKRVLWQQTPTGRLKRLLRSARYRSKRDGIEFAIELEDLSLPETCPVLGIPIEWREGSKLDNLPSLDRVDNTQGYTKQNTRIISWRANILKRDATLREMACLIKYMAEHS